MNVFPLLIDLLTGIEGENRRLTDITVSAYASFYLEAEHSIDQCEKWREFRVKTYVFWRIVDGHSYSCPWLRFGYFVIYMPRLRISLPLDCRLPVVVRTSSHIFFERCSNPAVARTVFRADTYRKQSLSVLKKLSFGGPFHSQFPISSSP